ncbi:DUF1460 domain-containing protein [Nocardia cyriacigeorgica]|uniref:DUF1460 domain-containing protein n=1 Tax=Nocardia cyriacigeorgica TaxID=135487 RepID=UPI0018950368|nr:DUF1460 domain-containing protein [Nocardia cyriacigeorgica]MBF6453834.1 DUF1460 domain-containing protein [Nocardia cyriacigeorgica]MBF6480186.1 DUF1460 domain-containing protein [Nocardia cyriacigeorgica]MBF6551002.1 DUF1460 domain-containing protein [Nocardia cyriacigeorgica]
MRIIVRALLLVLALVCGPAVLIPGAAAAPAVDDVTARRIDELLAVRAGAATQSKGELIEVLSRQFLGTPYGANMLIGSATEPEQLVVDLRRVDCFTYLDYVEALSRSTTREEFIANLIDTRYTGGRVEFTQRKHFFTDWAHTERIAATDITATLPAPTFTVTKHLNAKADGSNYLPGLPVVDREISYIPSTAVDDNAIAHLRTGDYIGAYADQPGLDVTHVGIFVTTPNGPVFRNASSLPADNKVVDTPFRDYVASTPGILVLRPN